METVSGVFQLERQADTLIVTPQSDLREMDFPAIESGAREMLNLIATGAVKNVVMDFSKTDYYGSTAVGFFVKVWKRVQDRKGRFVFCNVSDHEREVLKITKLDELWPICNTRADALKSIGN